MWYQVGKRKSLGQYFLRDPEVARQIAEATPPGVPVLEVGPGDGALTAQLLDIGRTVTAVEVDGALVERLNRRFRTHHDFDLITGNILKMDWAELGRRHPLVSVAGNLPYHLASPILFAVFDLVRSGEAPRVEAMVVMVQREVGRRLTAQPNSREYGALTLLAGYHGRAEYLFTVPANRFMPRPRVDGAVIKFSFYTPEERPEIDYFYFRRVVRACFAQRRKMMRNALRVVNDLPDGWQTLAHDFTRRPEQFTPEEFYRLATELRELDRQRGKVLSAGRV